jgi:hypothetical protein
VISILDLGYDDNFASSPLVVHLGYIYYANGQCEYGLNQPRGESVLQKSKEVARIRTIESI